MNIHRRLFLALRRTGLRVPAIVIMIICILLSRALPFRAQEESSQQVLQLNTLPGDRPCDIRATLVDALRSLANEAGQRGAGLGLYVEPDIPDRIPVDEHAVRNKVIKMVSHALNFPEAASVRVELVQFGDERTIIVNVGRLLRRDY